MMKKMTPIQLLRQLMNFSSEVTDYQLVTILYEEYVRMSIELNNKKERPRLPPKP